MLRLRLYSWTPCQGHESCRSYRRRSLDYTGSSFHGTLYVHHESGDIASQKDVGAWSCLMRVVKRRSNHTKSSADLAEIRRSPVTWSVDQISNSLRASDLAWLPPTVHSNCSEAWLQEPCFCSVVIFVNIVRFPPLRYRQISSAIAETTLYLRFGRGMGKREKEEAYVKQVLNLILPANQNNSPGQPKWSYSLQLLCIVGGNRARSDARSEFEILEPELYLRLIPRTY